MTDNPASVRVTIHEEVRDPIDNQPCMQDVVISDFFHTLLVHFDTEGAMTLRRVATTEVTYMHLSADMATALSTAHLTWMQQIEAWNEQQEFERSQKAAEQEAIEAAGPTQDQLTFLQTEEGASLFSEVSDSYDRLQARDAEAAENAEQMPDINPFDIAHDEQSLREAAENGEPVVLLVSSFEYAPQPDEDED